MAQKSDHIRAMKPLLVSEFKNHCVGVLNEVADYGEEVIVTKRGKPLARIVPVDPPQKGDRVIGDCSQIAAIHADIAGHNESNATSGRPTFSIRTSCSGFEYSQTHWGQKHLSS